MILRSVNFRPGTSPHTDVFRPKYRKANVQSRIQTYDVINCYHPSSHSLQQYNRPTRWIGLSQITPKHLRYDRYNGRYRATTVFSFLTLKCITLRQNSFFGLKKVIFAFNFSCLFTFLADCLHIWYGIQLFVYNFVFFFSCLFIHFVRISAVCLHL